MVTLLIAVSWPHEKNFGQIWIIIAFVIYVGLNYIYSLAAMAVYIKPQVNLGMGYYPTFCASEIIYPFLQLNTAYLS